METTLPYGWYSDPEILRRERERILRPAWQYVGHSGQLAQPRFPQDEPGAVDTWGPFVFAHADPDPEPLAQALGSLPAQVAELGLEVDSLVHHSRWEAEIEANWKIVSENFLECYHCEVAHPAFSKLVDVSPEAYVLSTDGRLSTQHGPLRTVTPEYELPRAQFHFLWPNLGINIFPGRPNLSIGPIVPLAPDRTYRFLDYFFGPDVEAAWIDDLLAFDDQVGREDRVLVEGVQRGIASGALEHGVLMSRSEQLIAHFQALTSAALAR